MLPHMFRVGGLAFLITMGLGHLPALFAVPAGLGDIAAGIAAPFIARRLARGAGRRAALWFEALGITDLVVALGLGGLTGYKIINVTPVNDSISGLPLALIPTVGVPVLLALHIVATRQLLSDGADTTARGPPGTRRQLSAGAIPHRPPRNATGEPARDLDAMPRTTVVESLARAR